MIVIAGANKVQGTRESVCRIQGQGQLGTNVGRLCRFGIRKLISDILKSMSCLMDSQFLVK